MANLEGRTLCGQYQIISKLGTGGMAEVYKAFDLRRLYHVAIKILREDLAEDPEVLRHFQSEADAMSTLTHTNIVRFYEFAEDNGLAFLVMDFIDGITLRRVMTERKSALSLGETLYVLNQVCRGLEFAHEQIVHRDVKPSNIMLQKDGMVLIADFGIAKVIEEGATGSTGLLGTVGYMSPEQVKGEVLDRRSDIYSLGITAYEMVTGRRPFVGDTDKATGSAQEKVRWQQINQVPARPTEVNPELPPAIEQVILKALEKDRDKRQSTAMEFLGEFKSACLFAGVEPKKIEIEITEEKPVEKKKFARKGIPFKALIPIAASAILVTTLIGIFALGKILPLVMPQAFATQTPTISVGATSTAQAQATGLAGAQATTTAQAQVVSTRNAEGTATAKALATDAAKVQASLTTQAQVLATTRAEATAQVGGIATAQAFATDQARRVPTLAPTAAPPPAPVSSVRHCSISSPSLGSIRFDNWVGLHLEVTLNGTFMGYIPNGGNACTPDLPPGNYGWRAKPYGTNKHGEDVGSVFLNAGDDLVIPFCIAGDRITHICQ